MKSLLMLVLLVFSACQEKTDTPEAALRDFTRFRMERKVSREEIMTRTTGKIRVAIETMTPEEFEAFADLRQFKVESFKIISKSCQEGRCYLTYSLSYRQAPQGKVTWSSEVKKIAEMFEVEGKWLVADVSNIKTYHEASESIEVSP